MRILITGSEGFLGKNLVAELRHVGHVVTEMDILLGANNNALSPRELRGKIEAANAEVVVHLAGQASANFMPEDDPMQTVRENAGMTSVVAAACGDLGVRLVVGSTDQVYGRTDSLRDELKGPWLKPTSLYAMTKLWSEEVGELYAPKGFTALRFSLIYGPGMPAGPRRSAIVNMLWRAVRGFPIPVHGVERSWCYYTDAIRACRLVIEEGSGPYNIGRSDATVSMDHVARLACRLAGAPTELIESVTGDKFTKKISDRRLRLLGWTPEMDLEQGMIETLEWVRELDETGRAPRAEEPEVEEVEEEGLEAEVTAT